MNLGQVYTKGIVADYMTSLFSLPKGAKILDPCFGRGAFLESLIKNGKYKIEGSEIDKSSYEHCASTFSSYCDLHYGNFFDYDTSSPFDGIIMNPPYVRHEEINELAEFGVDKKRLNRIVTEELDPKANLYMYFIVYGLHLLRSSGEMIVIFPNTWEKAKSGQSFKTIIERSCSITEHIDVKGVPFHGVPVVDVEILKIKKEKNLPTMYKEIEVGNNGLKERRHDKTKELELGQAIPLSHIATTKRGKTTGFNKMFINPTLIDSSLLADIASSPKDVYGFTTKGCKADKYLYVRREDGIKGEVKQYLDDCAKHILAEKRPKALYDAIRTKGRWYETSAAPIGDIIFPYIIRESIRFIRNERNIIARDNFYTINSHEDPYLLMCLLNNHYIWYQLEKRGKTYGNNVLKIQKYDVDALRIIRPDIICEQDISLLKDYGQQLTEKGDTTIIENITNILEKYYGVHNIKEAYEDAKQKRLNK